MSLSALQALKKNSSLEKLTKALQQTNKQKHDERFWQPTVDKAGNGFAIIRFLEAPIQDGEDGSTFVQLFTHGFEGPGGWYIENSLTTLGQADPVSEYNSKLWKTGNEANKKIAQTQKRRLSYISNILVIKDPGNPANEGKVFLYSYGKKIYDKIRRAGKPTSEEIEAAALEGITLVGVPVFSFWEGHDFKLKVRKVEGYRNYDTSEFVGMATSEGPAKGSAIATSDEAIEKIWKQEHSLKELVTPDKFKTYAELEAKMKKVLGMDGAPAASKETIKSKPVDKEEDKTPPWQEQSDAAQAERAPTNADDDKMLGMFQDLADEE